MLKSQDEPMPHQLALTTDARQLLAQFIQTQERATGLPQPPSAFSTKQLRRAKNGALRRNQEGEA